MLHKISTNSGDSRVADVLFLHGLGGDAFSTWRYGTDQSTSWPHWLASEFPDVCFWSLKYAASPTERFGWVRRWFFGNRDAGHAMSLPDRAREVIDLMVHNHLGSRPLLLICHSLGGLLAKQILRRARDESHQQHKDIFTNTKAILFLGTPHHGATLASMAKKFKFFFGTTANIDDLRAHDAHLGDLFDWYRRHSKGIETFTYFETRSVRGFRIVDRTSSHPGVGPDPVGLDEDHISLAKPRDQNQQVVHKARQFVSLLKQGVSGSNRDRDNSVGELLRFRSGEHQERPDSSGEDTTFDSWVEFVADRVLSEINRLSKNTTLSICRALSIEYTGKRDADCAKVKHFFQTHSKSETQDSDAVAHALNQIDRLIEPANHDIKKVLMNIQDWLMTTLVCPTDNTDIALIRDCCDGVLFVGHPVAAEVLLSVADLRKPTFARTDDGKVIGDRLLNLASPPPGDQRPLILVQHYVTELADRIGVDEFDNREIDKNDDGKCIHYWAGQLKLIFETERARTGARFYCCCPLPVGTTHSAQLLSLLCNFSSQIPDLGVFRLHTNQGTLSAEEVIVPLLHKRFERSH
jgi:pimeloyl-ACP methyl ester carboxylesterase